MDLSTALAVDLLVLVSCATVILVKASAGHSHPAVIYLVFHGLVVTSRAYAIWRGAPTFLSGVPGLEGVTEPEIVRAMLYADLGLFVATLGWMTAPKRQTVGPTTNPNSDDIGQWRLLRAAVVRRVAVVALPLGVVSILLFGFVPGTGIGPITSTSSYVTLAVTWPGLVLVALIYQRGFKTTLVAPLVIYLGVIALQGFGRFRLIVPAILLVQIYLDRHGKRWPNARVAVVALLSILLFFPLKQIGRSIQSGAPVATIQASAQGSIADALVGRSNDQAILDQLALTLSLVDRSGKIFAGRPYLSILTLPVPRELWRGKPTLSAHLRQISTPERPIINLGTAPTLLGDLYLNFRLPGMMFMMFILARWSGRLYASAYRRPYDSVGRFTFLLLCSNLIQIYRDGLISIPVFLLVQMLPLMIIIGLHMNKKHRSTRTPEYVQLPRH